MAGRPRHRDRRVRHGRRHARRRPRALGAADRDPRARRAPRRLPRGPRRRGDLPARPLPPRRDLAHARRPALRPGQLLLCRRQLEVLRRRADPLPRRGLRARCAHLGGATPGWPFGYDAIEPWYQAAETLYEVRGDARQDPTEPRHSGSYPHPPVPDEPAIAALRARLARAGVTPVRPAARRRRRPLARPRRDALGRLSRHHRRQDGRRERGRRQGARAPERHAPDRRPGHPAARGARRADHGGRVHPQRQRRQPLRPALRAVGRRGQLGGAAPALGRRRAPHRARQPLRPGRAQLHEPQLLGGAGDRPAVPQHRDLPEDASRSTTSTSPAARTARRSATCSCSARSPAASSPPPRRSPARSRPGSRAIRSTSTP